MFNISNGIQLKGFKNSIFTNQVSHRMKESVISDDDGRRHPVPVLAVVSCRIESIERKSMNVRIWEWMWCINNNERCDNCLLCVLWLFYCACRPLLFCCCVVLSLYYSIWMLKYSIVWLNEWVGWLLLIPILLWCGGWGCVDLGVGVENRVIFFPSQT